MAGKRLVSMETWVKTWYNESIGYVAGCQYARSRTMISHLRTVSRATCVLLALTLLLATPVFAAGPMPGPHPGGRPGPWRGGPAPAFGEGMYSQSDIEIAAEYLGMEPDELANQLWAGKTLAEIAESKGVDITELRNAVDAARYQMLSGGRPSGPPMVYPGGVLMRTTAWGGLNLRYGPSTRYGRYATVPYGTHVHAIGETQWHGAYRWTKILYNGRELWAASMYLAPAYRVS